MIAADSSGVSHWNSSTSPPNLPGQRHGQVLRCVELFPVPLIGEVPQCVLQFGDGHPHGIPDAAPPGHRASRASILQAENRVPASRVFRTVGCLVGLLDPR
jgi:hypothetical protein